MSSKRDNKAKTINIRKRRTEYILDNSEDDNDSEDNQTNRRRRVNYTSNLLKTSITPRKGRDLERTRSRPSQKVEVKSPQIYSSENEIDEEENDEDENTILYAQSLINSKEKFELGKNILMRSKYKTELQKKEFKEKIQKVFKEIYTYYYNSGHNKTPKNVEKELKSLTVQISDRLLNSGEDFLHLFLKLLHDNVSVYVKTFKDSIKERNSNKKLRESFLELKKQFHEEMTSGKDFDSIEPIKIREEMSQKYKTDIINFCKENRNDIILFINDLNRIYTILKKSSPILNEIFKTAFKELEKLYDTQMSIENIHKEEFFNVIINDEFIKYLIIEVKTKEVASFHQLRAIINHIEEEISSANKDMHKLKAMIVEIDKLEKEEQKEEDLSYLNDAKSLHEFLINTSKNNHRIGACININCQNNKNFLEKNKKYQIDIDLLINKQVKSENSDPVTIKSKNSVYEVFSPNISKVKLKNNENQHKNLDELYEYITADDNKQTKKQNKKNTNKTNLNVNQNIQNNSNKKKSQNICQLSKDQIQLENDKEIEEFKNKIKIESIHANNVRKVKPKLTFEWIQFISKV